MKYLLWRLKLAEPSGWGYTRGAQPWETGLSISLFGIAIVLTLGVVALFLAISIPVIVGERWQGSVICTNFEKQTGYETKFVVLNVASGGTCLAKAPNGHWVKNTQILQIAGGK